MGEEGRVGCRSGNDGVNLIRRGWGRAGPELKRLIRREKRRVGGNVGTHGKID